MKAEVIFSYTAMGRGRDGDRYTNRLTISSSFDDPAKWPYVLKTVSESSRGGTTTVTGQEEIKISKDVFLSIKHIIASHPELMTCKRSIDNGSMDGSIEHMTFACDSFSCQIGGDSIRGSAAYEMEKYPRARWSDNATVYAVYLEIKNALDAAGLTYLY